MQIQLRDYQKDAVDAVARDLGQGVKRALIVAPTSSGKSIIIAGMVARIVARYPEKRILVLCHMGELLLQNESKLNAIAPHIQTGIYCAGEGRKEHDRQVVFASRDSLGRNPLACGRFDVVIVDEAHMVNPREGTQYQKIFAAIDAHWTVGLTGTPWRLDNGKIWGERGFFESVSYNIPLGLLVERGFIVPHSFPPKVTTEIDTSKVEVSSTGDFKLDQLEAVSSTEEIVSRCLEKWVVDYGGAWRRCTLFFCCSIVHAKLVRDMLVRDHGLPADEIGYIDGDLVGEEREAFLKKARAGGFIAMVTVGVLTTGVDIPIVDCVVMLRATKSAALWVQSIGRGLRVAEGKKDCLVIDMAGNFDRFGSLENPMFKQGNGKTIIAEDDSPADVESGAEPVGKKCPQCATPAWPSTKQCKYCLHIFISHTEAAHTRGKVDGVFPVDNVRLESATTKAGEECVIASFYIGRPRPIKEWILYERAGRFGDKARERLSLLKRFEVESVTISKEDNLLANFPKIVATKYGNLLERERETEARALAYAYFR